MLPRVKGRIQTCGLQEEVFNKTEAQKEVARKTNVVKYICGSYLKAGFQISKSRRELKRKTQHGPLVETEQGPQRIRINERLF